jgi:hypothetical protein
VNSKLPKELPPNLIYWDRCETVVNCEKSVISNCELKEFYKKTIMLRESEERKDYSFVKKLPMMQEFN